MADGTGYYRAALAELRAGHHPIRSLATVPLPTLAWLNARLGRGPMSMVVIALLLASLPAWYRALEGRSPALERVAATVLVAFSGTAIFAPHAALDPELVAGLLLSLALALYRPTFATPALLALAAALAVSTLALPFALLWLAFALFERRYDQVRPLLIVLVLFALGLVLHHVALEPLLMPGNRALPGWLAAAGPLVILSALGNATPLGLLPTWLSLHLALPLALAALVGWLGLGGRLGVFAVIWFAAMAPLALFARLEGSTWALLALPAYGAGLAFAPRALSDLARTTLGRRVAAGAEA